MTATGTSTASTSSTGPEPDGAGGTAGSTGSARRRASGGSFIGVWGLLTLTVAVFALFAVLLPDTFPTATNLRAILTNQSIPAILALAATIPIVTGRFDLSIGFGIGLAHVMALWLLVEHGVPWPLVAVLLLVGGVLIGLVNGFLVELAKIDSFIATLGTGSMLYALTGWITGGGRIVPGREGLPPAFTDLTNSRLLGLPVTACYVLGAGRAAVDRAGAPAPRAAPLRRRGQPARRRPGRHPPPAGGRLGVRRVRGGRRLRRRAARGPAADR